LGHSYREDCGDCECAKEEWRGQIGEGEDFAEWFDSTILVLLADTFTGKVYRALES